MVGLIIHVLWIILVILLLIWGIKMVFGAAAGLKHDAKQENQDIINLNKALYKENVNPDTAEGLNLNQSYLDENENDLDSEGEYEDVENSTSDFNLNLSKQSDLKANK